MTTKKNNKKEIDDLLNRLVRKKESEEKNSRHTLNDTVKTYEKRESPKIPIRRD